MKTHVLPNTGLTASAVVLGMMRIASLSDARIRDLVAAARDAGVNVFDHADIYGGERHACERRFGEAVRLSPAERESVVIQSKCGIRPGYYDFSTEHIVRSAEESLAALRTDHLDLLLLHRPDTLVRPEEVAEAFDRLHRAGKVAHFGVSNHTPGQIELLRRVVDRPLVVNQVQLSITHAPLVAAGLAANMAGVEQSADRDNGLLEYSRLNGITLQAWSPFQRDFFHGGFLGDREDHAELNTAIDELAEHYGVTPAAIAIAWITRHPADIQTVIGTTRPERVTEAAAGADIVLTRQEWYRLFTAAGHLLP
ncbi:aldo/keto reductase [Allonocardiopsis opalescens]|uniref:Putative oxidoreductase n=1 Tax=Allonocardiopsis opalescens TaxID=1144618 RepID=A0A2T0Q2D8_9ACTN|nr:aldo/keto reductase [Allonocardiopsis opalescens]PRX97946.1 putative oxidoreductase [Allonocardiopsis opalescens]